MAVLTPLPLRRLTVAQYRAMAEAGILTPDDRIELLDCLLVQKEKRNPPPYTAAALRSVVRGRALSAARREG